MADEPEVTEISELLRRQDRTERILLIMTRDYVDQFSGKAEAEQRRMVDEIRGELGVRSGDWLVLPPT